MLSKLKRKKCDSSTEGNPASVAASSGVIQGSNTLVVAPVVRVTAATLRVTQEMRDFDDKDFPGMKMDFPDMKNIHAVKMTIIPDSDSIWFGGKYEFDVTLPDRYPILPPQVSCTTPVWHPNIDMSGNVCLSVLRKGWNPTFGLKTLLCGLNVLFTEPNPDDPINSGKAWVCIN